MTAPFRRTTIPAAPVCLFAQFDPENRVRPTVIHYVGALRRCGYDVVVAVSGTRLPPEADRERLAATGARAVFRVNAGHDFGAWRDLIREGHADGAPAVLLANDSVFGPFAELAPVARRMDEKRLDVWGMVESGQLGWHLQSWFLRFGAGAFASPRIRRVLDQPFHRMPKMAIIQQGELELGRVIRREGMRAEGVWRTRHNTLIGRLWPQNPMHLDWRAVLLSRRVPFIKADLLRLNSTHFPAVGRWRDLVARTYGADTIEIDRALNAQADLGSVSEAPYETPCEVVGGHVLLKYLLISHDRLASLSVLAPRLRRRVTAWFHAGKSADTEALDGDDRHRYRRRDSWPRARDGTGPGQAAR